MDATLSAPSVDALRLVDWPMNNVRRGSKAEMAPGVD